MRVGLLQGIAAGKKEVFSVKDDLLTQDFLLRGGPVGEGRVARAGPTRVLARTHDAVTQAMAFRDNQDRDKVLAASDIVEVIGEHVQLRAKGREFYCLCPFHDDKKPSMAVSPQKQIFKCFPCGAGGSVFDFVMKYHKMTFPESLKYLADRAGIKLTPWRRPGAGSGGQGADEPQGPTLRERLSEANRQALGFYSAMLRHEQHGREVCAYLEKRGVSDEMIERFQIGVAPDRWDGLATMVGHKKWDVAAFVNAGLIKPRKGTAGAEGSGDRGPGSGDQAEGAGAQAPKTSDCYDLLRHRLVFPICDQLGRPVAFGGRRLNEEEEPKYLNSPESAVFHKSATLYGLHLAKKPIIDSQTAVMVEGYTDVVACHQHGATNVVAALGTALTADHAKVLKRFAERIVLVMDGDAAGQRAADRAIEIFLTADLDVFLATIPDGQDPDELLIAEGLEGWDAVIASAQDALAWQFDQLAAGVAESEMVTGRQRLVEQFARRVVDAGLTRTSVVRRAFVVQRLAELMKLPHSAVEKLLDSYTPRRQSRPAPAPPAASSPASHLANATEPAYSDPTGFDAVGMAEAAAGLENAGLADGEANGVNQVDSAVASGFSGGRLRGLERAERRVIAALITDNELFHAALSDGRSVDEAVAPAEFATPRHRAVYQQLFDALCDGQTVTLAGLMAALTDQGRPELGDVLTAADDELAGVLGDEPTHDDLKNLLDESAHALTEHDRERRFQQAKQQARQQHDPPFDPDPQAYDPHDLPLEDDNPSENSTPPKDQGAPPAVSKRLAQLQALIEDRKAHPSPKRIGRTRQPPDH